MILYALSKQDILHLNERHNHKFARSNDHTAKSPAPSIGSKSGASRSHTSWIIDQPRATLWQGDMQMPTKRVTWTLYLFDAWTEKCCKSIGLCSDRANRNCQASYRGINSHRCRSGGNFGYQRRIIEASGVGLNDCHQSAKRNGGDHCQYGRSVPGGSQ